MPYCTDITRSEMEAQIMELIIDVTSDNPSCISRERGYSFCTSSTLVKLYVTAGGDGSPDISLANFIDGIPAYLEDWGQGYTRLPYRKCFVFTSKPGTTNRSTLTLQPLGS
jgi:hypothetical protein